MGEERDSGAGAGVTFILFGATGDLARRKLLPALYHLWTRNAIDRSMQIVAVSRRPMDDDGYRAYARAALKEFIGADADAREIDGFVRGIVHARVDIEQPQDFATLAQVVEQSESAMESRGHRFFYLAIAPDHVAMTVAGIQAVGLTSTSGWKRLVIEKPFGVDRVSAQKLNDALYTAFVEDEVFRIDHYLGKEMVQNIEVLRFANSLFETVWNNQTIANVQITSSETVGVMERAGYYEQAGAIRDMVQNHMLQMVMMVAMEPPSRLKMEAIRDEKVKVLRSLRRFDTPAEIAESVVRGQYVAPAGADPDVRPYRAEAGVAPSSMTETFVAARLYIDNFRWAGVPFYIRTGKRMQVKATEIVVQFRDMPKQLYFNKDGNLPPNRLVIRIHPVEGMSLCLCAKHPGRDESVVPITLDFSQETDASYDAYERLLQDALVGDSTYFTRWDEVSLAWRFIDPIAQVFAQAAELPLHPYAVGTMGPTAAYDLVGRDGVKWWPVYGESSPVERGRN
ncbi:MAG: glucose-6-phosphate dehydrogenase [Firmicutes bacterium]|nr:glucose-6-phosphate dehydrogenase [Bacillota bacterium]